MSSDIHVHKQWPAWVMAAWAFASIGGRALAIEPSIPTFVREIAPLLWKECGPCHHPGGAGPFSVLTFAELQPHLRAIRSAIEADEMPPWPPEPGHGDFLQSRRLAPTQRQLLLDWLAQGAPSGPLNTLPTSPTFPTGWQLGTPDLILPFPTNFLAEGSGQDLYRNFVLPLPSGTQRLVRGIEFLPESPNIHHARFLLDTSGTARRLDNADPACGFGGTMPPGQLPEGQLGGWVPGRQPSLLPSGQWWPLPDSGDFVVQLHVQRKTPREVLTPRIGLYLTHGPAPDLPVRLGLVAQWLDIPPRSSNQVVIRSLQLPAAARLISVMPHAHQRAREVELTVTPPDQQPQSLLLIRHWRFNWQDEYRYREPMLLPAGTRIEFRITFDNPSDQRVRHGPNSSDEMAELWLQLSPEGARARELLLDAARRFHAAETVLAFTQRLQETPKDAGGHLELGKALAVLGRDEESFEHLAEAADLNPALVEAHYHIGLSYLRRELWVAAARAFSEALSLDPRHQRSYVGLGLAAAGAHRKQDAIQYFDRALLLNPNDPIAKSRKAELEKPNSP